MTVTVEDLIEQEATYHLAVETKKVVKTKLHGFIHGPSCIVCEAKNLTLISHPLRSSVFIFAWECHECGTHYDHKSGEIIQREALQ